MKDSRPLRTRSVCSVPTHPIWFGIPSQNILSSLPNKTRGFASIIPGHRGTYVYRTQADYYRGYEEAHFALTMKKGGFECLRHYEILARGSIPYFLDWDAYPLNISVRLPRAHITEAMSLPGVPRQSELLEAMKLENTSFLMKIPVNPMFSRRYSEIASDILKWTKRYLSVESLAQYVLDVIEVHRGDSVRNLLFLSSNEIGYQSGMLYIGFQLLNPHLFWPVYPKVGASNCSAPLLYGSGFSYCESLPEGQGHLPSWPTIEDKYRMGHFDVVIYSNEANRGCDGILHDWDCVPWVNEYLKRWPNTTLAYVDGSDIGGCHRAPLFNRIDLVFSREMQPCP